MTTTPFLELAKRIDANPTRFWGCCVNLHDNDSNWLEKMFKPTAKEIKKFNMFSNYWLSEQPLGIEGYLEYTIENNQFRILILLLAHEVWLDENNNTKK